MGLRLVISLLAIFSLAACSSAQKQRQIERDKLVASTGLYCDFINGDEYQDIEVKLNLEIARRCDPSKNYTISSFKNSSDLYGMLYCCSIPRKETPHLAKHEELQLDEKDVAVLPPHVKPVDITTIPGKPAAGTPVPAVAPAARPVVAPPPAAVAPATAQPAATPAPAKPVPSASNTVHPANRAPASVPAKAPVKPAPTDPIFDE